MVRVGEAHPDEPVAVLRQGVQVGDGAVGHPLCVVEVARDRVGSRLGRAGGWARAVRERGQVAADLIGVFGAQPHPVVQRRREAVHGQLDVLEASQGPRRPGRRQPVLRQPAEGIHRRLEVGLADERRAVPGAGCQVLGDARTVIRKDAATRDRPVGADVLAGHDAGPGRGAGDVLPVGAVVVHPGRRQAVKNRCAGDRAAVAAQRVIPLLVAGDQQNIATQLFLLTTARLTGPALWRASTTSRSKSSGLASRHRDIPTGHHRARVLEQLLRGCPGEGGRYPRGS